MIMHANSYYHPYQQYYGLYDPRFYHFQNNQYKNEPVFIPNDNCGTYNGFSKFTIENILKNKLNLSCANQNEDLMSPYASSAIDYLQNIARLSSPDGLNRSCYLPYQSTSSLASTSSVTDNQERGKRYRTSFTVNQMTVLELHFSRSQYMVGDARKELAKSLGLRESQVKIWFQNRRIKYRKQMDVEARLRKKSEAEQKLEAEQQNP